ncbi:hypothetical protein OROMI_031197 [Orobanche minor]
MADQLTNFFTEVLKNAIVRSIQEEAVKENAVDIVAKISHDPRVKENVAEVLKNAIVRSIQEEAVKENAVDIVAKISHDPRVQSSPINVGLTKLISLTGGLFCLSGGLVVFTGGLFLMKAGEIVVNLFSRGRGPRGGRGGNQLENEGGTETTRTLSLSTGFRDGRTFHESINQISEISPITSEEFNEEFNMVILVVLIYVNNSEFALRY